ncbi:unnamed protein product [Prorocentrum cordatum]|uniref:Uncharacterized protein n=1 Tax=Prorocentrum cordatum TaxID=2364126 RepID=A0ABN9Y9Q1_9DINO|nr:unnamed protein product [Polarella glacialis]
MQACVVGCNLIWISSLSCLESSRQLLGVRPIHLSTMIVLLWSTFLGHPALGKFYIATDGDTHPHPEGYCVFWEHIDSVITDMGFKPIRGKCHLPAWLMMFVGWLCQTVGGWFGLKPKLTCFSVRMLLMNRWFRISAIERDLGGEGLPARDRLPGGLGGHRLLVPGALAPALRQRRVRSNWWRRKADAAQDRPPVGYLPLEPER